MTPSHYHRRAVDDCPRAEEACSWLRLLNACGVVRYHPTCRARRSAVWVHANSYARIMHCDGGGFVLVKGWPEPAEVMP